MQGALNAANKYISFQKSFLNITEETYEQVKTNLLKSDYLTSPEKTDEFLTFFVRLIDKRPRNVKFYIRITKDVLSSNQYFMEILKEFLFSVNDRKSSRIYFLYLLWDQLKLISIEEITTFILNLFKDKAYQYMRIHRKLTLSLFYWFAPEIQEHFTKQNQLDSFQSYIDLLKEAHDSPYFKTLTDINLNFIKDYDILSANNWEKHKLYRSYGMSYDPIALSISKDSVDDFIQSVNTSTNISKYDGTISPSVFECCSFLNHYPTYLQYAAYHGSINIFNFLLESGSDRTILDHKKRKIEDYAIAGGCKPIVDKVFKLYYQDEAQKRLANPDTQPQEDPKHQPSHGSGSRRKRDNPFEIGAERTFSSCSNRIQRKYVQQRSNLRSNQKEPEETAENDDDSNSPLFSQPQEPAETATDTTTSFLFGQPHQIAHQPNIDSKSEPHYSNYNVAKFIRCETIALQPDEGDFFESCKCDCLELVIAYLETASSPDVNAVNAGGTPAISVACQYGSLEVVKFLVNRKSEGQKIDLSLSDETGAPPLVRAASFGQLPIVRFLVDVDEVDVNAGDERGTTALIFAAMKGYCRMAAFLLGRRDVDVGAMDEYYGPAFVHAAMHGHLDVLRLLAARDRGMRGEYASFAIIYAAHRGFLDVIRFMLARDDVDLNARNIYDETPLTSAASGRQLETIKFLVKLDGIDLNQRGPNGNSALLAAAAVGDLAAVQFLCGTEGVDVALTNSYEANALDLAVANKNEEVAEYLRGIGLKQNKVK